uniref:Uncharacterized protein n=1 Tax=Anguilla anguilla TaxID=7936 RepID=A0A0E9RHC3_ANGAN
MLTFTVRFAPTAES